MKAKREPPRTILAPFTQSQRADLERDPTTTAPVASPPPLDEKPVLAGGMSPDETASQGEVLLPIANLERTPFNSRAVRIPERIHQLMEEMRADGQRQAITVAPKYAEPGRYLIIDGETRYEAAMLGGIGSLIAKIDTKIDTSNPLAIYTASRKLNGHIELSDIDKGIKWASLINEGYTSIEQLAAVEGISVDTLNQKMVYLKLPAPVLIEIKRAPASFPYSLTYEIYRLCQETDDQNGVTLASKVVEMNLSRREVKAERERMSAMFKKADATPRQRRRREKHTTLLLEKGRGEYAVFNTPGNPGKAVVLTLNGLSEKELLMVEELVTTLRTDVKKGEPS